MKTWRALIFCCLALGLPLQGWASVSQAFCRMSQAAGHFSADHAMHTIHADPLDHGAHHALPHDMDHPLAGSAAPAADAPSLADVLHQCGQCAQCAAAHAMASVEVRVMHWPKAHPVWVGAVPKLHGRVFTSAPERPPRALTV